MTTTLGKTAAQGVFWTALGNYGNQLASLVVFVVLSNILTPADFGVVALATVFTALMKVIADQGFADALVQRVELETLHLETAFWASVLFGTTLAGLISAFSWLIADLVNEPEVGPVLVGLSLTLVISSLSSVQRAILLRDMRFQSLTLRTLVSVVAGGVAGIIAALQGLGVWSLVIQLVASETVSLITLWNATRWRPALRFSKTHFIELTLFGASVVGFRLLRFVNTRMDNLIIGTFLGATALGFYVVAYRLLQLMIDITTGIVGGVAFPVFSRIQDDPRRVQNVYYKLIRMTSAVAFPAYCGLIVLAPEVTRLVFGGKWDASVPVMRVLAVAGLALSILNVNGVIMKSLGKPSRRLAIMGVTAISLAIAFSVAVNFGILAVATGFVVVTYLSAPFWILGAHKLIHLSGAEYLREIIPPLVASAFMVGVTFGLKPFVADFALLWRVLAVGAAGLVAYAGAMGIIARPVIVEALAFARMALPSRATRVG